MADVRVWGGFGEKKSNSNTQWYIQDRVYDSCGICPALTTFKADYWIVIRDCDKMWIDVLVCIVLMVFIICLVCALSDVIR